MIEEVVTYSCWVCGQRFEYKDVRKHGIDGHEKDPRYSDKINERIKFQNPVPKNPCWEKELKDVGEKDDPDDPILL
jgi:hypothetical protein